MTTNTLPTSDMPIPTPAAILVRAVELRADAVLAHDAPTVKALDRVIVSLSCGATAWWLDGNLCVTSVNSPGVIYVISCGVCSCPARKPCWHMQLLDLILDIQDTLAGDADLEADADDLAMADDGDNESDATIIHLDLTRPTPAAPRTLWVLSDYAVRRFILVPALRRTQAFLAGQRDPRPVAPQIAPAAESELIRQAPDSRARTAHGRRIAQARRPLFAREDAETARLASKGELRAQLEIVQAKRAAAREAADALYT